MAENQQVLIDSLPVGKLTEQNYRFAEAPIPKLGAEEVLVKTIAFGMAAGSRAGLQGSASYAGAPQAGVVMGGGGVGEVAQSNDDAFPIGTKVSGPTGWQTYSVHNSKALTAIPEGQDPVHR